ncbi:MAG: (Fe-S)-binding protein [Deltaproteobacteria bacterium]|nr:MAG: (Fe-S)-binding protein [Deltaproteobacteria bacterium]RLB75714.1 MAG: (Fe-S)-binding protein [Deltaproteobacteria bacterium]
MSVDWARIEREFYQCNKCGLCLAACPVGKELLLEKYTPRGKIQLARFCRNGNLEITERLREIFAECLLCGACSVVCPSGVSLTDLFIAMREMLTSSIGLHANMKPAIESVKENYNISNEDNDERDEWAEDLEDLYSKVSHKERAEVVYFIGCVASFFPMVQSIPRNVIRILDSAGVDFAVLGGREWCCGFPLLGAGAPEDMKVVKEHNLEMVRSLGAKSVVFSCPSCYRTWREYYGTDFSLSHVTEFIAELLDKGRLRLGSMDGHTVTYHDPCDLGRHGGVFDAPRKVIQSIPGISLKEMESNRALSTCCGGGGNLEMTDPELSRRLAIKRIEQALATGADTLVTACQQCVRTLKGAARRGKIDLNVVDITDLVARAIK